MTLPRSIRSSFPLLVGLVVGVVGASMFLESMPGSEGSPKERADKLEVALKQAQNRIAALEAATSAPGSSSETRSKFPGRFFDGDDSRERHRRLSDRASQILQDLREGRPVSPDDIFRIAQPMLHDLSPLFDRMRVKSQLQMVDSLSGELARKYNLTPQGQEALKKWFERKANEDAKRWSELVTREGASIYDVMRATQNIRPDEGLDAFMPSVLSGDQLATFKTQRMAARIDRVQRAADMKVQQLNSIVNLDETQRDQVFGIMARSSHEYDPAMVLEGAQGEIAPTPGGDAQAAILSVLRPDQRTAYEAERKRRRDQAAKEMDSIGLALPPNWEMLGDDFR